ncbi:helix-turn-helix domain-containing protein [Lutibacter sp.]|uniref:helix-turn-helix domain-containing protein n=1 Tax=Lutibacter sp. TaxID=1925666 RepID=UPI0025BCE992|nr:helix-turn-helix domain-containing protein [Lutibacter sp.]MCF6182734.1 helix-turn-helix domain-containing protein [Lutibacter sp.]
MISKIIQIQEITVDELADKVAGKLLNKIDVYLKGYAIKNDDTILTRQETAKFLKINLSTLWSWSKKRILIPFGMGNRVYYKKQEIIDYLENHRL